MSKILGSWSGMRKYLEQEMLAEELHGRVRYNCTSYVGMDGCHVVEVYIDDVLAKRFSWETVNSYFISNGLKTKDSHSDRQDYWKDFWTVLNKTPLHMRTEYTDEEFCEALERYRNQPIKESLCSENPIERMFAILDRRVRKRTLESCADSIQKEPQWLRPFYELRLHV